MALRVSTSLRDKMLGRRARCHAHFVANTLSFDAATSKILDSGSGFITKGVLNGDIVSMAGTASNNSLFTVTTLAAGALTVTPAPVNEAAGTLFSLAAANGGALIDVMRNGKLMIYSGSQPATADTAVAGTLLQEFTIDGGAWVAGSATNGINFDTVIAGVIVKATGETWKSVAIASGTAGWFRFVANAADAGGSSTTLDRIDGSIGTTTAADMQLISTAIVAGKTYYLNDAQFIFPYQYGA